MKRKQRTRAIWIAGGAVLAMAAIVVPLLVFAGSEKPAFTATLYSDVIRFEANGVASLRVTIYDLSETELWSSGQVMGVFVDWDRANARGERLANGYYMYLAQGWDSNDQLILNKAGKVVLLPGDQVEFNSAPLLTPSMGGPLPGEENRPIYSPKWDAPADYTVAGKLGVGTGTPNYRADIAGYVRSWWFRMDSTAPQMRWYDTDSPDPSDFFSHVWNGRQYQMLWYDASTSTVPYAMVMDVATQNLGINTLNPTDRVTIECDSGNAIAVYPGAARGAAAVFRVEADGDVYADGTVYSRARVEIPNAADVAERINVSEWVEAGDVVEIDPDHTGFFRKASGLYSRRVAGIISTSPGVILGNDINNATGSWNDNRPILAIAGRVPVKVSTENGPIAVGDLLVSSSAPGIAMKGDPIASIGAVVGKAMEALESDAGVIMAQVTLR